MLVEAPNILAVLLGKARKCIDEARCIAAEIESDRKHQETIIKLENAVVRGDLKRSEIVALLSRLPEPSDSGDSGMLGFIVPEILSVAPGWEAVYIFDRLHEVREAE